VDRCYSYGYRIHHVDPATPQASSKGYILRVIVLI
jgi:hypothetical protein